MNDKFCVSQTFGTAALGQNINKGLNSSPPAGAIFIIEFLLDCNTQFFFRLDIFCILKDSLSLEPYLAVEHNKCYCESCAAQRGDPPVKYHGNPGAQMKSAVPLGWVKCALR